MNSRYSIVRGVVYTGLVFSFISCGGTRSGLQAESISWGAAPSSPPSSSPSSPSVLVSLPESSSPQYSLPDRAASSLFRQAEIPMLQVDACNVYRQMLNYVVPEILNKAASAPLHVEHLTVYVDFPASGVSVNPKYGNNPAELEKLKERLKGLTSSSGSRFKSIELKGFASPDGNTKENERLSGSRVVQFKNYLVKQLGFPDNGLIRISWVGEDWQGFSDLLSGSNKKYREAVLAILSETEDGDERRKRIRSLEKGAVYKDIEKTFFSKLRRMELSVATESPSSVRSSEQDLLSLSGQFNTSPEKMSLNELLILSSLYRQGTEQYREVYELAAYRFPGCVEAQLNAGAASLSAGDKEAAHFFLRSVENDPRSWNNLGVLSLMDGDVTGAISYFRKAMYLNPRLGRQNIEIAERSLN